MKEKERTNKKNKKVTIIKTLSAILTLCFQKYLNIFMIFLHSCEYCLWYFHISKLYYSAY